MRLWRWYRARRRGWRIAIALVAVPLGLALLYAAGRSLQYASAEKDPGLYVPSSANVVVRCRGLAGHGERIGRTLAWRALERRILRDRTVRRTANAELRQAGFPTLDDLEDSRKGYSDRWAQLIWVGGEDTAAAARVGAAWKGTPWVAAVRLPWSLYLAAPFGGLVLPTETVAGRTVLRRSGLYVVFVGAIAIASNDRAFLEQALRRQGSAAAPERPVEARVEFGGSAALQDLRRMIAATGAFPHVRAESIRAISLSVDVVGKGGEAVLVDALFEEAEAANPETPPHAFSRLAPAGSSGLLVTQAGAQDLFAWLKSLVRTGAPDAVSRNAQQALDQLEGIGKFSANFLPLVEPGMAVITGTVMGSGKSEGRVYPALALVLRTRDPAGAFQAMDGVIRRIAGNQAKNSTEHMGFQTRRVGDREMHLWRWPGMLQSNDFLMPCYAAAGDAFVLGNNEAFTEAVLRAAGGGTGILLEQAEHHKLRRRLKEYGFAEEAGLAGGFLFLRSFRESLDGFFNPVAEWMVDGKTPQAALRVEIERELALQGRSLPSKEVDALVRESLARKYADQEDLLRSNTRALDAVHFSAFESSAAAKGISFRWVMEFR